MAQAVAIDLEVALEGRGLLENVDPRVRFGRARCHGAVISRLGPGGRSWRPSPSRRRVPTGNAATKPAAGLVSPPEACRTEERPGRKEGVKKCTMWWWAYCQKNNKQ